MFYCEECGSSHKIKYSEEFEYCERIVKFFVEKHHDAREDENIKRQDWIVSDLLSFLFNNYHRLKFSELREILKKIPKHILKELYKKAKKAGYLSLADEIKKELGCPLPLDCDEIGLV